MDNSDTKLEDEQAAWQQRYRMELGNFIAREVLGWREQDGGWYAPEFGICLYARGQSSRFSENWLPTYVLDQAMHVWNHLNLSADITFDCANEDEDSNYRYTIELKADHSIGTGNTLQEAICNVIQHRYGWRFEEKLPK